MDVWSLAKANAADINGAQAGTQAEARALVMCVGPHIQERPTRNWCLTGRLNALQLAFLANLEREAPGIFFVGNPGNC